MRRIVLLLITLALSCCACGVTVGGRRPAPRQLYWLMSINTFRSIRSLSPDVAQKLVTQGRTFVVVSSPTRRHPRGTTETELFTSYASFRALVSSRGLSRLVHAVIYDPEYWNQTPVGEQETPLIYMSRFSRLARREGVLTILAPARDLVYAPDRTCNNPGGETIATLYLRCDLARAAAYASMFEIQDAPQEADVSNFRRVIRVASSQAHKANRRAHLLATLSTAPSGDTISARTLLRAARSALPYVTGFELNVTAKTERIVVGVVRQLLESKS